MTKSVSQEELMTLVFQVGRQLRKRMRSLSEDTSVYEKVSPYQMQALFTLMHQPATMGELAEEMGVTLPSATSLVDRLVKSGLAERTHDERDRRVIRLVLTEEGKTLCAAMKRKRKEALRTVIEAVPDEDMATLHRILTNVHQRLEDRKPKDKEEQC